MLKNTISQAINLLLLVFFIPGLLLANMPPNNGDNPPPTPCDGKCGGGCEDEYPDEKEPEDDAVYCPKCGAKLNSLDITIPFGHPVHTKLIPAGKFKIYSKRPTPTLFTPQKLTYDFNFESYLETSSADNSSSMAVSLIRPDGFAMKSSMAMSGGKTVFTGHHCGSLQAVTTRSASSGSFVRESANGSKTVFTQYTQRTAEGKVVNYYKSTKIVTQNGIELTADHKDVGIEVIRDSNRVLRQVYSAADGLADIVVLTPDISYEIRMYPHSAIGSKNNGVYNIKPGSVPYLIWRIENSTGNSKFMDKVRITRIADATSHVHSWEFNDAANMWTVFNGSGDELVSNSKQEQENTDEGTVLSLRETRNSSGNLVSKKTELHKTYDGGELLMEKINDPEGVALKTSYDYHESSKLQKKIVNSNGSWKHSVYNENNYVTTEIESYKDTPYSTSGANGLSTINEYASHDSADIVKSSDGRPRTITQKINGTVVSKKFFVYKTTSEGILEIEEIASDKTANYGNSLNLRTVKAYDSNTGRLKYIIHPNGTQETYIYEYGNYTPNSSGLGTFAADNAGFALSETIVYGTIESPRGINGKSIKRRTITDRYGNQVQTEIYALVNGSFILAQWQVSEFNIRHKIVRSLSSASQLLEMSWIYDAPCQKITDTGTEYIYEYNSRDLLSKEIKKGIAGQTDIVTTYTYNADGKVISSVVSGGNLTLSTAQSYDMAGRLVQETDASGLITTYSYQKATSSHGDIVTKTNPGGFTEITEYYLDGKIKSITGTAQAPSFYDYGVDSAGNQWVMCANSSDFNKLWQKTYTNTLGQTVKIEKSGYNASVITTFTYNALGLLVKKTSTGVADELYEYDALGNLIRQGTDVNGNGLLDLASMDRIKEIDQTFISENGNLYQQTIKKIYGANNSANATVISTSRQQLNNLPGGITSLVQNTDRFGNITETRVSVNRSGKTVTTEIVSPDSTVPAQTIAVNELKTSERSKTNLTTTYTYDALGRLTGVTDPRTGTFTISYYTVGTGKIGKRHIVTNAAGNTTTYDYDSTTGRKISECNALGKFSRFAYNSYGQVTKVWGESEYPLEFAYDQMGRKIAQTTYRNTAVSFAGTTFPSVTGDVTAWTYDESSGLVTSKKDAKGKSVSYTYSPDGKLLTRTWARGITTTYSYDAATGELLKADYSDATQDIERTYNRMGNLASVSDAAGARTFTYDENFNLTGETLGDRTLVYTYSASGIKGRYIGLTGNHSYSYDQYGRINQINDITYNRLTNSELIAQVNRPNGVNSTYGYEANRDIESDVGHGEFASYGYSNNAIANRTSMSRSGSVFSVSDTINYSYNDRSEVTGALSNASSTNYNYTFAFDPIGNRLNAELAGQSVDYYTTNILNQYTAVNATAPTYDDDGNMLAYGNWSYAWNGENRLIQAINSATGVKLEFDYDYMGRRIFKKVYSGETLEKHLRFVYDGYKLIEERDVLNDDALVRSYVWQPESLDRDVPLTVYDASAGKTYYYHTDANKNVTELSDENGEVVAHYEYSPFGSLTKITGVYAASNPFRFSSEYFDEETGLVYYNYRYYNPELGRWISRDPIEEQGGYNLYGMIGNNPLYGWDMEGLNERSWGRKILDWFYCLFCGKAVEKITDNPNSYLSQRDELLGGKEERQSTIDAGKDAVGFVIEEVITSAGVNIFGKGAKILKTSSKIDPNPFKGKTSQQIDKMFRQKKFSTRGPDPVTGKGGYVNPKTGRSYHIDQNNRFNEPPHVDVNRPKDYNGNLPKKKYPME